MNSELNSSGKMGDLLDGVSEDKPTTIGDLVESQTDRDMELGLLRADNGRLKAEVRSLKRQLEAAEKMIPFEVSVHRKHMRLDYEFRCAFSEHEIRNIYAQDRADCFRAIAHQITKHAMEAFYKVVNEGRSRPSYPSDPR